VVPLFLKQRAEGRITITDREMTRFFITLDQGARFVINCLERMTGGEIFVPKIPSMKMADVADALGNGCRRDVIGIRPGEKVHEVLLSVDEARHALEEDDMYVIHPDAAWADSPSAPDGRPLPRTFSYASDTNEQWLGIAEFLSLVGPTADSGA
jgi:FlaA1/EpsC-like NDP-sugar epimerase